MTIVGVIFLTALGLAPAAAADTTDAAFLLALSNGGVRYGNATDAISWAHTVCEFMDEGKTMSRTTSVFQQAKGWTNDDAGYFVGAAARIYCPWNIPPSLRH